MNRVILMHNVSVLLVLMLFVGCVKNSKNNTLDTAVTGSVKEIDMEYAIVSGEVNLEHDVANRNNTEFGVEVAMSADFSCSKYFETRDLVDGKFFSVRVTGLNPATKYYYRSYVRMSASLNNCGETLSFITETPSGLVGKTDGYSWVDLGLPSGTKWATCNIGASSPEDFGDYFAWGETKGYNSGKTVFDECTYIYCKGCDPSKIKYCTKSKFGKVDNKTTLEPLDDAACANWGGSWRMPTQKECRELIDCCTTTWTTMNEVYGILFKSKNNGMTIFLPASGCRGESSLNNVGTFGGYWSSSLRLDNPDCAWRLDFNSGYKDVDDFVLRIGGSSVRAVCH